MGTAFLCGCGHAWALHDIYEPSDPRELCCVDGCDQRGCPGNPPCPTCGPNGCAGHTRKAVDAGRVPEAGGDRGA